MATFSLMREENGRLVQVGESVEATLPLTEPLTFGPLPVNCRATIKITTANCEEIGEYRSGDLFEGDTVHLDPRGDNPERSIWTDMLRGL